MEMKRDFSSDKPAGVKPHEVRSERPLEQPCPAN